MQEAIITVVISTFMTVVVLSMAITTQTVYGVSVHNLCTGEMYGHSFNIILLYMTSSSWVESW